MRVELTETGAVGAALPITKRGSRRTKIASAHDPCLLDAWPWDRPMSMGPSGEARQRLYGRGQVSGN